VNSINYEVSIMQLSISARYFLSLSLSYIQIFSSTPCSQTFLIRKFQFLELRLNSSSVPLRICSLSQAHLQLERHLLSKTLLFYVEIQDDRQEPKKLKLILTPHRQKHSETHLSV